MCRWPLPAQSFSVVVPWDLLPYFTVSDLRLPLSSPPTTRRITVEVFELNSKLVPLVIPWHRLHTKHPFQQFLYCSGGLVAVGTCLFCGRYLVTGLHDTILIVTVEKLIFRYGQNQLHQKHLWEAHKYLVWSLCLNITP
jgi:hypothetical protein